MSMTPGYAPKQSLNDTLKIIKKHNVTDKLVVVGVRGYFKDTMGKPGVNDRGIYDDAIFIVSPDCFISFNANCDPGAYRKHIANLKSGVWRYRLGIHGLSKPKFLQYTALVQAGKVTVRRDQEGDDTGYFGINIHKGGYNTVSSLGCQTIYPSQWPSFIETIKSQLKRHGQSTLPYILVEA